MWSLESGCGGNFVVGSYRDIKKMWNISNQFKILIIWEHTQSRIHERFILKTPKDAVSILESLCISFLNTRCYGGILQRRVAEWWNLLRDVILCSFFFFSQGLDP